MRLIPSLPPSQERAGLLGWSRAALALAALPLLGGCDYAFWRMDGPQSTMDVDGAVAQDQLGVFYVTCWVTFAIFVIVASVLAYATVKFRARDEAAEHAAPPEQSHGNPLIEVGLIAGSVLALVFIAVPTLKAIWFTYDVPEVRKGETYNIVAQGYQWWFRFEYPNEQIKGVGPLTTSNELVIPAGRPIRIDLRGMDVIHSFWVPKLAGKVDMIPNRANFLWLDAPKPGKYYWGQCAEYCGDSHAVMRFRVIALSAKDFGEWLDRQTAAARDVQPGREAAPKAQFASYRTDWKRNEAGNDAKFDAAPFAGWQAKQLPAPDEDAALIAQGRKLFTEKTCFSCHMIRGHHIGGSGAYPDLTHVGSRTTIAAGLLQNTPEQMARWISHPDEVKPGNKMYSEGYVKNNIHVTPAEVAALVAYLQSLK